MPSLKETSPVYYSNACYHREELDTFEMSQSRQAEEFVQELIKQHWLTNSEEAITEMKARVPSNVVKMKADNLLRMTKSRAIQRLKTIAS